MTDKTLHMIGNAHIDPVWLWNWQEGFHEVKASFRSALDRMNEYPDFKFVSSSAVFYEWVEKSDPKMFEEIKLRVKEGRWEIVGGWWLQPDCNIPAGESFVRQGLYGQHYFKEKFGITAKVGYNVDSFGHNGMLPQILKKSGLDYYVFMRPHPHEKGIPSRIFWWQSDDGSKVLTFRIPFEYTTRVDQLDKHVAHCADELKAPYDEIMCFYGVGNHGGGPTKANIESIQRIQKENKGLKLLFSTPNTFFESVSKKDVDYPLVHQELQRHAVGCYAAHSGVKQWNRLAENRLMAAEKWSSLASLVTGQAYPDDLERAWKAVLFNQFHDILAGTSLESAYTDAQHLYGEAITIADRAINYAVQSLAWNIHIPYAEDTRPLAVFNPHAWETHARVELQVEELPENPVLIDDAGNNVPMQFVQSLATASRRQRISFLPKLPALGYRTYHIVSGTGKAQPSSIIATESSLENAHLKLMIDPQTGFIKSLYDKDNKQEVFTGAGARPVVISDPSDTWSHDITQFKDEIGEFIAERVYLVDNGPAKATLRIRSRYGDSSLIQDLTIYPDLKRIDVQVMIDWHEEFKMLKFRFPVNVRYPRITYEIPYGHVEREGNGDEVPGQSWVDVSGVSPDTNDTNGLSILNDGKYSFDAKLNTISMTVLRSPIYAHHDPVIPSPDDEYMFIDKGLQRFQYVLMPHADSWDSIQTPRRAAELNQPPFALLSTFHDDGKLAQSQQYVWVEAPNVIVSVIKKAEDNDDLIVRAYETDKTTATATIHLAMCQRTIETTFTPCEIKTFRVPRDPKKAIVETNLLEWKM